MDQTSIAIQIAIKQWEIVTNHATKLLGQMSDEALAGQIAPNKNTGSYIMGHLIALHDAIPQFLGIGQTEYPELADIYLKQSEGKSEHPKTVQELRQMWLNTHERVTVLIKELPDHLWLTRHTAMTDEDFEANPLRNKLSILINRTNHFSYHVGQLRLLMG